jgi:hypothetical protein
MCITATSGAFGYSKSAENDREVVWVEPFLDIELMNDVVSCDSYKIRRLGAKMVRCQLSASCSVAVKAHEEWQSSTRWRDLLASCRLALTHARVSGICPLEP